MWTGRLADHGEQDYDHEIVRDALRSPGLVADAESDTESFDRYAFAQIA